MQIRKWEWTAGCLYFDASKQAVVAGFVSKMMAALDSVELVH